MDKLDIKLGVIGAGNMGGALIKGIASSCTVSPQDIFIADNHQDRVGNLVKDFGVTASSVDNIVDCCGVVIVAVKPDAARVLLKKAGPALKQEQIIVSVAAGLSVADILSLTGGNKKIIRVMPNTAAQVGEAMSPMCAGGSAGISDLDKVFRLFSCVGRAAVVTEDKMDAVVGVSGSSPAFIFQVIEAMSDAGVMEGLKRGDATLMAAQAVLGAAKMVLETGMHPGALKDMVTSPAGATIEGVYKIEKGGVRAAFIEAVSAAAAKSRRMGGK